MLGLAFKPGTDDIRRAGSVGVVRQLQDDGHHAAACDPVAVEAATPLLPGAEFSDAPYATIAGADVVALVK